MKRIVNFICSCAGGAPNDLESQDGPDSGVGVDHYYRNKKTGQEVYVNDDQGHLTFGGGDEE